MLEDERPHGVSVTFGANRELAGGGAHLVTGLSPMGIVAVGALDKPDIDTVTVRPGEFSSLRGMAPIAQRGLRLHQ